MVTRFFTAVCVCLSALIAFAAGPSTPWLPAAFNGWQLSPSTLKSGTDPSIVDPTDGKVLAEYGFTDFEEATYTRNGRTMQVKAARFKDLSGALGAFTFYAQPQMAKEDIGDRGVSNKSRILFYRGNILVDATLERVTAMSAADLRALAGALPRLKGEDSAPPPLPGYVPKDSLIANSDQYIEGPEALARVGSPIPASFIDFARTRDVEVARYATRYGRATLVLVDYPTKQIALERMRAWQASSLPGGPFYFRNTGPLLAAINGNIDENQAQSLLASINYDADVTMTQPVRPDRSQDRYGFIVALVLLVVIVLGAALIIGLTFGGLRVWLRRVLSGHPKEGADEAEIIRLNLK